MPNIFQFILFKFSLLSDFSTTTLLELGLYIFIEKKSTVEEDSVLINDQIQNG